MQQQMGFVPAIKKFWTTWTIEGRSARSEFWWPLVFSFIPVIGWLNVIPGVLCAIRRMHDIGKPAWYVALFLIPVLGWIFAIYMLTRPSMPEANEHGPVPNT